MYIYAKQLGADAYLLDVGLGLGRVVDLRREKLFLPAEIQGLLHWSYWVAYNEEQERLPALLQTVTLSEQPAHLQTAPGYPPAIRYHIGYVKFLIETSPTQGQILDMEERLLYPSYEMPTLVKRNHWEPYKDAQSLLPTLLTQVMAYQRPAYLAKAFRAPVSIIAHSGMRRFLLKTVSGHGRVLDLENRILYLPMQISTIMSHDPYWTEYTGSQDTLKSLLKQVTEASVPETGQGPRPGSGRTQETIEKELSKAFPNRPPRLTTYRPRTDRR